MLTNETVAKLRDMRLSTMANQLSLQLTDDRYSNMSFEDRLSLLVDAEWANRKSNQLKRLIQGAGYVFPNACVEDIEYRPERKLSREQILRLSTCTYLLECYNVVLMGTTGAGKSYIACALGIAANRNFYTSRYIRLPDLLVEARSKRGSTIYCSQMDIPGWHENLYDPTLADAICDRIVHDSYIIRVEGDSMRKHKGVIN